MNTPRAHRLRCIGSLAVAAAASLPLLPGCVVKPAPPAGSINSLERLDVLERAWPGLQQQLTISWDRHAIPSIHAASADDAAYGLGIVHAHLRPTQIELLRRVSQGRISQSAGPLANSIDEAIRSLDLGRAVPEMKEKLPDRTRRWLGRYVAGVNDTLATIDTAPPEARSLNIAFDEPWTVEDILRIGRLASVDVAWGRWLALLPLRDEPGYDDFIARLDDFGDRGLPSFEAGGPAAAWPLTAAGRTGSNALVVGGKKSHSGAALVASDPHLGILAPGPWCVVGYRYPGQAAVGLTIPGVPFVVVGRNEHIAWTGTNMQSASSVLYEVDDGDITSERPEKIPTRFWFDRKTTLRSTGIGPVVTDADLLSSLSDRQLVMRWRGHEPSDEMTAFLDASLATDWAGFRAAFATYAVGGQNMLFGDRAGNIGQILALEAVPAAAAAARRGPVSPEDPDYAWTGLVPSTELPSAFNPPQGFLVSANNTPTLTDPPIVPQGNANDRFIRMTDTLSGLDTVHPDDLATLQRDTYSDASRRVALAAARLGDRSDPVGLERELIDTLRGWDGRYETDSRGAAAYQLVASALVDTLYEHRYAERIRRVLRSGPYLHAFLVEDLANEASASAVAKAVKRACVTWERDLTWGDLHRLRLSHPIGAVPVIGKSYRFMDLPWPGSTTTVYKSAHAVSPGEHRTTFGANARLLIDMANPNTNRVVLLGGQDGRVGASTMLDQVDLWKSGSFVPLPLTAEAQLDRASRVMHLRPAVGPDGPVLSSPRKAPPR